MDGKNREKLVMEIPSNNRKDFFNVGLIKYTKISFTKTLLRLTLDFWIRV